MSSGSAGSGRSVLETVLGGDGAGRWAVALARPLAISLGACGIAVGYAQASAAEAATLILLAICLRGVSMSSGALGSIIDAQRERNEYYESKFGRFAANDRRIDPMTATAGDRRAHPLTGSIAVFCALSIAMGWSFLMCATSTLDAASQTETWYGLAAIIALVALEILAYVGRWRYRCRPYGLLVSYASTALGLIGAIYMMTGTLIPVTVFAALGLAALATSLDDASDLVAMPDDSRSDRRTLAIAAGAEVARAVCAALSVLGTVWMAAFTLMSGMSVWRLAFLLLCIPMIVDAVSMIRARPSDMTRLEPAISRSCLLACVAFACCIAGPNIVSILS